jgi:hypothetical protein
MNRGWALQHFPVDIPAMLGAQSVHTSLSLPWVEKYRPVVVWAALIWSFVDLLRIDHFVV